MAVAIAVWAVAMPLRTHAQPAGAVFSPLIGAAQRAAEPENATDNPIAEPSVADVPVASGKPYTKPATALYHSLAIPGWGQLDNGKWFKAAVFFAAEAVCVGGYAYEQHRLLSGDVYPSQRDAVRTDRNSFILYLFAAKVLGIMDAYVDAQFQDYDVSGITPPELRPAE